MGKSNNILVFLDTAAYGCLKEDFERRLIDRSYHVRYVPEFESFEYCMLNSNLLKDNPIVQAEFADLNFYANHFISWETYFEDLIDRATYKKFYRCTHGRVSKISNCWLELCEKCDYHKFHKCDVSASVKQNNELFSKLFLDTQFQYLQKYSKREGSKQCVLPKIEKLF